MPRAGPEGPSRGALVAALRRAGALLLRVPRARAWIPVLLWMGLITLLSSAPGRRGGASQALALVSNLAHAPLYGVLGLWLALLLPRVDGWPRIDARAVTAVLAAVLAFGALDELHQAYVARRDLSVLDLVTDGSGAACVLWVASAVGHPGASAAGLRGRLLASAGLCLLAAALATWLPGFFPGALWM